MEKPVYIAVILILVAVISFSLFLSTRTPETFYKTEKSSSQVSIELTPIELKADKLFVSIEVNTHSTKLDDFDLSQLTTLYYDNISLKPISSPKLSGHHSSGILVFNTEKELKGFKIIIKNIPDIKERAFEWK